MRIETIKLQILFVVMIMKRTNGICIFLLLSMFLLAGLGVTFEESLKKNNITEKQHILTSEPSMESDSQQKEKYMALMEDDVIVIYEMTDWQKFLTTDISSDQLPESILEDLKDGIGFASEKDLYAFLENYSS